jgi:hypothetical protein
MLNSLDSLLLMILTANPTSTLERSSEAVFFFYDYDLDLLLLLLHGRLQLPSMKLRKAYKLNRTDSIVHSGPIQRTRSSCGSKKPYNSYGRIQDFVKGGRIWRARSLYWESEGSALSGVQGQSPWAGGQGTAVPLKLTTFYIMKRNFLNQI